MNFAIITHVIHGEIQGNYFGYSPYVREMNVWLKYVDKVIIVAPKRAGKKTSIESEYNHHIDFRKIPEFNFLNFGSIIKSLILLPGISFEVYKAMKSADHIHLRCPGNVGLLGCVIQMFFPEKIKTAKYAGNWDPKSRQPLSYRIQKWILSNTFLTKNIQVLVYGEWKNSSKNIKPFFTASYFESEKSDVKPRDLSNKISFLFVGTLSKGKQPLYVIQLMQELKKRGNNVYLTFYGEGEEREKIENYISNHQLEDIVFLKGNQNQESIKKAYLENHFIVLPSLSEGWPKVIAEGMFWGCLPIASKVSCVPNMLGNGERGLLLEMNLESDVEDIDFLLKNDSLYKNKVEKAVLWSRGYTMDVFENEVKILINENNSGH